VSNGHISPGVYATLALHGFVETADVITGFRKAGSMFAGHIETKVPGASNGNTGNLGQGLSAGAGAASRWKLRGNDGSVRGSAWATASNRRDRSPRRAGSP
jgi:transketolase